MAMLYELAGAEYLCQMTKLHLLQGVLQADLVLDVDPANPADQSRVVTLQTMQIRQGWGPEVACLEHVAPDARIVISSGGDGK